MYLINKMADDAYAYNGAISQEEQNLLFCLYLATVCIQLILVSRVSSL